MMKGKTKKAASLLLAVVSVFMGMTGAGASQLQVRVGDADMDGGISASDARFILRLAVGLEAKNDELLRICDVDGSGAVDSADARTALRASVGLEPLPEATVTVQVQEEENPDVRDSSIFSQPIPAPPSIYADSDTFTITVYGNGHGVGMSQWGAVFMANAGYTYEEIIAYFYKGCYVAEDPVIPPTVMYNGTEYSTEEIVARITSMEIGGIAEDTDAVKAQAVAVYTLFKYYGYKGNSNNVGVAASSYERCSERLKSAVHSVLGQYASLASDMNRKPVLTVYSALHAGRSMDASYIWGSSYPVSVPTPFEYRLAGQTVVYRYFDGGVQTEIADGFGNTVYLRNAANNVIFDKRATRQSEYFAEVFIFPRAYIEQRILEYAPEITLDPDPGKWIEILEHNSAIDSARGYVKSVRVGSMTLKGVGKFSSALKLGLRSDCFTVTYNR